MGELQSKAESSVGEQAAARAVRCGIFLPTCALPTPNPPPTNRQLICFPRTPCSPYYGTRRPTILQPPAHLTGELPGDYGFDPLGLAADGRHAPAE